MIKQIRHTGLVVSDLDKALYFWCDILGFQLSKKMHEFGPHIDAMMGLDGVEITTAKLEALGGGCIELLYFHSHLSGAEWAGSPFAIGLTHIALTVTDLDKLILRLQPEGVKFPGPPQYSPDGSVKVIYAKGPEGILLELVEILK